MQSLNGKVAVVTGGSRGIGFAIAQALVAEGVKVVDYRLEASRIWRRRGTKLERARPGKRRDVETESRRRAAVRRRRAGDRCGGRRASAASISS